MRLIKAALKASFAHTGQLTNTDNQLIPAAGTSTKPAYTFAAEPTLGFYRSAAGAISVAGGRLKGASPVGAIFMFPVAPATMGNAGVGSGQEWLELDGSTYANATYPDLAAFLGQGGTTFTVPNMKDTARFPRSRSAAIAVGSSQSNTVGPHTHPDVTSAAETQEHTHSFSGTTGAMNQNAVHSHSYTRRGGALHQDGTNAATVATQDVGDTTSAVNLDHAHSFSGTTSGRSATHNHVVSTPANTGTTETRPEALAFVFCIKT
jgi:hypothetical protein